MKAAHNAGASPSERPDLIAAIKAAAAADPASAYAAAGYDRKLLRKQGGNLVGKCPFPFHKDADPSFNITIGGAEAGLFKCFGCGKGGSLLDFYLTLNGGGPLTREVVDELAGKLGISHPESLPAATRVYEVRDPQGKLVAEHHRKDLPRGKKLMWWERNGQKTLGGLPLSDLPLYRCELLKDLPPGSRVIVCEGEKATDALEKRGIPAVGTVTGAEVTPAAEALKSLCWFEVLVWPDADPPGEAHMDSVARLLVALEIAPKVVRWPDAPPKGDAADFTGTAEELSALLEGAVDWTPSEEPAPQAEEKRPRLDAGEQRLEIISTDAWAALLDANTPPLLFLHGGRPARFEADGDDVAILQELTEKRLRYELARAAQWWKRHEKNGVSHEVPAMPPKDVVADMLAHPLAALHLPPVDRIVRAPVFAADGTLQAASGYHPAGRIIVWPPEGLHVPEPPAAPTAHDIEAAVAKMGELIVDFPFVDDADRAAAFGLFLQPFVRDMIDGPTPLHLIEAPTAGTGKGLLAAVLLMPAVGDDLGVMTQGRDEDEWRKRISTCLREGKAAVMIDNVTHPLNSGALSSALTAMLWSDRLLGTLDPLNLPVRCAWVATGNNPTLSTEIARRSIRCRLDAGTDRPFQRDPSSFLHPSLREWTREHRAALIGAALTLVQAWLAAGRPEPTARPLGSYESWTRVIGGILQHAGIECFLANLDDLYERADSEGAAWRRFVEAWWDHHQAREVGVAELYGIARDMEDLDLGRGETERAHKIVLGKGLARRADMVLGGFRIEAVGTRQRLKQWRLTPTQPAEPEREAST